jgi:hypothetical protein
MRKLIQGFLLLSVAAAGLVVAAKPVVAEPSFGSDAAFPVAGVAPNTILEPAPGSPVLGPTAPPPATVYPSLLAPPLPPAGGEVDDFSFGDEFLAGGPPSAVEFSVSPGATGHPAAPPPPPPQFDVRMEAGVFLPPPFGDGAVGSDIYQTGPIPIAGPVPCAPVGSFFNKQILDDDGAAGPPFGPARLGVNMPAAASNIDAYDRSDDTVVNPVAGVPLEAPVFFTIDAATAAGWPAGPIPAPGFVVAIPGPSDILAYNPIIGGPVIWATAGALGLIPGDDIDALAVQFMSGAGVLPPFGPGFDVAPGFDSVMFSLAPGSPSLSPTSGGGAATPLAGCAPGLVPGTGTAADLWYVGAPLTPVPAGIGGAFLYINAEAIGLNTARSGGGGDDNMDAVDWCNTMVFSDIDGDFSDDGCDPDMDGDGIGNGIDPDDDGDGFGDPQQTMHLGPTNTAAGFDNCPMVPNPAQTNTDGNYISHAPVYGTIDRTKANSDMFGDACDSDDDNDGLLDADESSGALCGGIVTMALVFDTDGDTDHDGAECALGTDPTSTASQPAPASCGAAVDGDGDRLTSRVEYCGYNTADSPTDTDGDMGLDGARDGCEAASLNADRVVNSGDQLLLAAEITRVPPPAKLLSIDVNKDGGVNAGDQLVMSSLIATPGQCP